MGLRKAMLAPVPGVGLHPASTALEQGAAPGSSCSVVEGSQAPRVGSCKPWAEGWHGGGGMRSCQPMGAAVPPLLPIPIPHSRGDSSTPQARLTGAGKQLPSLGGWCGETEAGAWDAPSHHLPVLQVMDQGGGSTLG